MILGQKKLDSPRAFLNLQKVITVARAFQNLTTFSRKTVARFRTTFSRELSVSRHDLRKVTAVTAYGKS